MSFSGQSPKFTRVRFQPRSADPVNPTEGDSQYADGTVRSEGLWVYKNGSWTQAGSGSQASSIITGDSSSFEGSIGSWVTYADAAAAQPVDGTGGSANITATRTTTGADVLNGIASLKMSKDAANRQGEGISLTVPVPNYLRGQPSVLSFSAKGSANFDFGTAFDSADPSDVVVYLYDVTNSKLLQPYPYTLISNGIAQCMVQVPSDCASIRAILHIATVNATAWDLFIDDVVLGAAINQTVKADSDWESYTPTFTGFGTATSVSFFYRKIGDSIQIKGNFAAGTTTGTEARISFPTGLTTDSAKMSSAILLLGLLARDASATTFFHNTVLVEQSVSYLTFGEQTSTAHGSTKQTGSGLAAAGDILSFITAPFPIQGWTAGATTAASANLNAPAIMRAYKNAGSITAATTIPTWTAEDADTVSAFDSSTGVYTVKIPGDYQVNAGLEVTATSTSTIQIRKNGSIVSENSAGVTSTRKNISLMLPGLKVGDTVTVTSSASETVASNNTGTYFDVSRLDLSGRTYATRVAYVTDERSAGTDYGTIASGSFATRTIQTLRGDTSFISLSSNQITLQPGTYEVDIDVPVGQTPAVTTLAALISTRLRNTSDSTTAIVGTPLVLRTPAATIMTSLSKIKGRVVITSTKTFEVQHASNGASSQGGFAGNNGEVEVYVTARIEKVL